MAVKGIRETHESIRRRLFDYITAQYFGKNELLYNARNKILGGEGNIYVKPYIESTKTYKKDAGGLGHIIKNEKAKLFFEQLSLCGLGVYKEPFVHQVQALKSYIDGKNLLVATGTGSGKTECFMWPLLYHLFNEAQNNETTWNQRGIRTIVMYPMNALVSDQIGRLRKVIGNIDKKDEFSKAFRAGSDCRCPQFGMYTGRTPYYGYANNKSADRSLAENYRKSYLCAEDDQEGNGRIKGLKELNKYPAKYDMESFVNNLENGEHITNSNDAELITRFEMQKHTPDILITNYSMLEYMLVRRLESSMWENTKKWLEASSDNKLLLIIDEAHMYKGSAGGEVALLLKRLFSRLNIGIDKVRFILTTASLPENDLEGINKFVENFTGAKASDFNILFGEKEESSNEFSISTDKSQLLAVYGNNFTLEENKIIELVEKFSLEVYGISNNFSNADDSERWLYDNLPKYEAFVKLVNICQNGAKSVDDVICGVFGDNSLESENALDALLTLSQLAKKDKEVLFPVRMHMFFRGLNGLYACSNPKCPSNNTGDGIFIGKIYHYRRDYCEECGARTYELVNDRRCGALYFKGYIDAQSKDMLWTSKGILDGTDLMEITAYICREDEIVKTKNTEIKYLDTMSGQIMDIATDNSIRIAIPTKVSEADPHKYVFGACPKCTQQFRSLYLTGFSTIGNEFFFNMAEEQFYCQPAKEGYEKYKQNKYPNRGKKLLIFSDSRQKAAKLARDMTKTSDNKAARRAMYFAWKTIDGENNKKANLNWLYLRFLEIADKYNLTFFYGDDKKTFEKHKHIIAEEIQSLRERGDEFTTKDINDEFAETPSKLYKAQLIENFCKYYVCFMDIGLGWLVPTEKAFKRICDEIDKKRITIDLEELYRLVIRYVDYHLKDEFAFDNKSQDYIRYDVSGQRFSRMGVDSINYSFAKGSLNKILEEKLGKCALEKVIDVINEKLFSELDDDPNGRLYLKLDTVRLELANDSTKWYRCKHCSAIYPVKIFDKCAICGSPTEELQELTNEDIAERYSYWIGFIKKGVDNITSIDTEEHTAQLSYKDQRRDTWATTEDFEMRFQDINTDSKGVIDMLSSTTTMEVGIDIGSLTAVSLRNVPPLRQNYQQRVGRAGRRGSNLSTITVMAQGGPHDTFYFNNPAKIISGDPETPIVDSDSEKLIQRHFNLILLREYFSCNNNGLDEIGVVKFFSELYENLSTFVAGYSISEIEKRDLYKDNDINKLKSNLLLRMSLLKTKVEAHKELYKDEDGQEMSFLDACLSDGMIPSYSFPRDVVGFNIFKESGSIIQKPERALDMALSEYAPGRSIVVNKQTYTSGAIFDPSIIKDNPARSFFNDPNYKKRVLICPICKRLEIVNDEFVTKKCPSCSTQLDSSNVRNSIRPWGFAPKDGRKDKYEVKEEYTYATEPCYSMLPKADDYLVTEYANIKQCATPNSTIILINKGQNGDGFDICMDCGAATVHNKDGLKDIRTPFFNNLKYKKEAFHDVASGYLLEYDFKTDAYILEIKIDATKVNPQREWLTSAAITVMEAMKLAISRTMDIVFNEVTGGQMVRETDNEWFVDIYFYDSLSSGAGYSTEIAKYLKGIIETAITILKDCEQNCNSSCSSCLDNYWNQYNRKYLNRHYGYQLLMWAVQGEVPEEYSIETVKKIFLPLEKMLKLSKYDVAYNESLVIVSKNKKEIKCRIKPQFRKIENTNDILEVSEMDITYALPDAYKYIINNLS